MTNGKKTSAKKKTRVNVSATSAGNNKRATNKQSPRSIGGPKPPKNGGPKPPRKGGPKPLKSSKISGRILNIKPDRFDARDFKYREDESALIKNVPEKIDYSNQIPSVGDQGDTGSCVGWATGYLRSWLHYKAKRKQQKYSARWIWMGAKEQDTMELNSMFDLSGTYIRDAFKLLRDHGALPDSSWPFNKQLPDASKENALKLTALEHRIGKYISMDSNAARIHHLANQGPVVAGVPVFRNWDYIGSDGIVPEARGNARGGHAILIVGYDNRLGYFKFQNSWSRRWGDKGFGYLSYDFMEDHCWSCWGTVLP